MEEEEVEEVDEGGLRRAEMTAGVGMSYTSPDGSRGRGNGWVCLSLHKVK